MNAIDMTPFEQHRPLMFSIAYRMLGSATEAEDILQEAYLRYQTTPTDAIVFPKAFLSTIVTRLCLNHMQLAQVQREMYIGPWLPEPILTEADDHGDSADQAELHESISMAFLTLLERLTPVERAVFLLREVFDYNYTEIATILGKEEAACRQMFSRAKKHVTEQRPRFKPTPQAHREILDQFIRAVEQGDLDGLMHFLTEDVTLWADGGGKTRGAALHPLRGRMAVGQFVMASVRFLPETYHIDLAEVNGEWGVIIRNETAIFVVLSIDVQEHSICGIRAIGNPDKLGWVNKSIHPPTDDDTVVAE